MNTKTTMTITEARKKIFDVAKGAQRPGTYYTLTEKGRPKVVIMSAEEFESWRETLDVIQECPNLDKDVEETNLAVKSGKYKNWVTLDDLLAKKGYVLAEKQKQKYGVSSKNKAISRKRTGKNS